MLLIALIIVIALFNFFSGSNSISVEASEDSFEQTQSEIKVHVAGEVKKPGLYKLEEGARLKDASATSAVTFCVANNESVAILGEEKGKDGKTWYKIAVGDSTGYIRSDLITKTDKKVTVKDSLVPKKTQESSVSSNKTNSVDNNANSTTKTPGSTVEASQILGENIGVVKGTSVRLRAGASVKSSVISVLDIGNLVSIAGIAGI